MSHLLHTSQCWLKTGWTTSGSNNLKQTLPIAVDSTCIMSRRNFCSAICWWTALSTATAELKHFCQGGMRCLFICVTLVKIRSNFVTKFHRNQKIALTHSFLAAVHVTCMQVWKDCVASLKNLMVVCFDGTSVLSHSDHYLNSTCPSSNLTGCLPFLPAAGRLISLIGVVTWHCPQSCLFLLFLCQRRLVEQ